MRKLASIRKIADIKPIEGADNIEAVRVDGWWVVAKKGEFQVDDYCFYFEIDSFLPVRPEFEFLRKSCFKSTPHLGDGFRLKTIKLRGQISQGLVIPLYDLLDDVIMSSGFDLGTDVTEHLGVKKWEPYIPPSLAGLIKGSFPSFIPKTDQERIQNCYEDLKSQLHDKDVLFNATLKLDGSSMTVYYNNGEFGVCSRNIDLKEDDTNTFWKMAKKLGLDKKLSAIGKNIAIQGELMGPGIQGNREGFTEHKFFVFDIWDIDSQKYLSEYEVFKFATLLDLEEVPMVDDSLYPFDNSLDQLLRKSEIESINHPVAEGLVYKSQDRKYSFKVINNQYLLGEK